MGLFDVLSSPFKSSPKAPTAPQFRGDEIIGSSRFRKGVQDTDDQYQQNLMAYLQREPGLTDEEFRASIDQPLEAQRLEEKEALASNNRGFLGRGQQEGGGRQGAEGSIRSRGMASRADIRRNAILDRARIALMDRINQLGAAERFVNPRMQMHLGHTGMRNQFNLGVYGGQMGQWRTELDQHNNDLESFMSLGSRAATLGTGGAG